MSITIREFQLQVVKCISDYCAEVRDSGDGPQDEHTFQEWWNGLEEFIDDPNQEVFGTITASGETREQLAKRLISEVVAEDKSADQRARLRTLQELWLAAHHYQNHTDGKLHRLGDSIHAAALQLENELVEDLTKPTTGCRHKCDICE